MGFCCKGVGLHRSGPSDAVFSINPISRGSHVLEIIGHRPIHSVAVNNVYSAVAELICTSCVVRLPQCVWLEHCISADSVARICDRMFATIRPLSTGRSVRPSVGLYSLLSHYEWCIVGQVNWLPQWAQLLQPALNRCIHMASAGAEKFCDSVDPMTDSAGSSMGCFSIKQAFNDASPLNHRFDLNTFEETSSVRQSVSVIVWTSDTQWNLRDVTSAGLPLRTSPMMVNWAGR